MIKYKKYTIQDIASIVGVSKTTISRYINGKYDNMSAETREKIRMTIERTGYRPSRIANALKTHKSGLVGLVLSNATASLTPYLLGSISDVVVKHKKRLLVVNSNDNQELEVSLVTDMLDQQIEGLIVTSGYNLDFYEKLNKNELPVVLVDRVPEKTSLDVISINHKESSAIVAEHLYSSGFKKITVISPKSISPNSTITLRSNAIFDVYNKKKDAQCEQIYIDSISHENSIDVDEKIQIVLRDTYENRRNIPTAIFITDTSLMGRFICNCYLLNTKINEQFTISGYDFWNFSNMIKPEITTIKHPIMELGNIATEHLIKRIENSDESFKQKPKILECVINIANYNS